MPRKQQTMLFLGNVNPFVPSVLFLYPLKTSENRKVLWSFQGVEKGCIGNKGVKVFLILFFADPVEVLKMSAKSK